MTLVWSRQKNAVKCYLEATPRGLDQVKAWERLAALSERSEDYLGVADAERLCARFQECR